MGVHGRALCQLARLVPGSRPAPRWPPTVRESIRPPTERAAAQARGQRLFRVQAARGLGMSDKQRPGAGDAGPKDHCEALKCSASTKQNHPQQALDEALHKDRLRRDRALLVLLCERWPRCFAVSPHRRRQLKINIDSEIRAALNGAASTKRLGRVLAVYTANKVYRSRLILGAVRYGLDGEPAGEVVEREVWAPPAAAAPPAPPAPPSPEPKRTTLSDLRAAAQRRREGAVS